MRAATPKGYEPLADVVKFSKDQAAAAGTVVELFNDPLEAVRHADVVVTDTWVSMGMEADKERRMRDFAGYQVSHDMMRKGGANPNWRFLHCLPRKPQEVTDDVFYSDRSLVWDEAENRMWTFMAVVLAQLRPDPFRLIAEHRA